jgi:hypothetical protein
MLSRYTAEGDKWAGILNSDVEWLGLELKIMKNLKQLEITELLVVDDDHLVL